MSNKLEDLIGTEFYAYPAEAKTVVVKVYADSIRSGMDFFNKQKIEYAAKILGDCKQRGKNVVAIVQTPFEKGMEYEGRGFLSKEELNRYSREKGIIDKCFNDAFKQCGIKPKYGLLEADTLVNEDKIKNAKADIIGSFENKETIYMLSSKSITPVATENLPVLIAQLVKADALVMTTRPGMFNFSDEDNKSLINTTRKAMASDIYVATASLGELDAVLMGKDTGLKFLPDSWATANHDPWYYGKKAYVSPDFMKAFKYVSEKGTRLSLKIMMDYDDNSLDFSEIKCSYHIINYGTNPFTHLLFERLKETPVIYPADQKNFR